MTSSTEGFEFPAMLVSAERASDEGQKTYMRLVAARLAALVVAAAGGALTWRVGNIEILTWVALLAFVTALGAEILIFALAPEKKWYEGRAIAESIKTLTWRYVCAGDPFGSSRPEAAATLDFRDQLSSVGRDMEFVPTPSERDGSNVPPTLQARRQSPFPSRRDLYVKSRLREQEDWYVRKAQFNERMRSLFLSLAICLEVVGVLAATLRVAQVVDFDLLGMAAAIVGGVASWAQTRGYGQLSRAYAITAHELRSVRAEAEEIDEARWPRFVDEAEESISREHTLWRASRGVLSPRSNR